MREIKFRAWIKRWKQMQNVGGIDFVNGEVITYFGDTQHGQSTLTVKVDEVEILQYTGLKDVNGVLIYEGDILKVVGLREKGIVEFTEDSEYVVNGLLLWDWNIRSEVIGNKFQNPELLSN